MRYMGSKARIAPYIVDRINSIAMINNIDEYYEPFMGGCSVGELVTIKNRHLSDINYTIVELFKKVQEGMWEYKYTTREEWYKVKDDKDTFKVYEPWQVGWVGIGCSFRNRPFEGFGGVYHDEYSGKDVDPQRQAYNSLCEEREKLIGIDFQHREYFEIGHPHHAIIYCDAPYRGTAQYIRKKDAFDFDKYDEWLIEMAKDNLVIISEYSMYGKNIDKFIEIDKWDLGSSIGAGNTDNLGSTERLYCVSGGWLTEYLLPSFDDSDVFEF